MMRTAKLLVVVGLAVAVPSFAAEKEKHLPEAKVPKAVVQAVKQKYPKAKVAGYEEENEGGKVTYEVDLDQGEQEMEVDVSPDGKVLSEETRIDPKDVPESVMKALAASKYGKAKVHKAERITMTDKPGAEFYELKVREGGKKAELLFDKEGKLVKETAKDEPRGEGKREAETAK